MNKYIFVLRKFGNKKHEYTYNGRKNYNLFAIFFFDFVLANKREPEQVSEITDSIRLFCLIRHELEHCITCSKQTCSFIMHLPL